MQELVRRLGWQTDSGHSVLGDPGCVLVASPRLVVSASTMMAGVFLVRVFSALFDYGVGID
jgi:hypothetical protein